MKNLNVLFLVLVSFFLSCNSLFAITYSEDNAVYWYREAFEKLMPLLEIDDIKRNRRMGSLDDLKKLNRATIAKLKEAINEFLSDIKKADSIEKCVFREKPTNYLEITNDLFLDKRITRIIIKGFPVANTLAWYAISINKPEVAGLIWQNILNLSKKISEHNIIHVRSLCGIFGVKVVLTSLDNYCKNGATNNFKESFVEYLKKWPNSIFNLNDAIKEEYDFQKVNIELYKNDIKYLALLFGAREVGLKDDCEPEIIENKECKSQRRKIEGAIEMYQMDEESGVITPDFNSIPDKSKRNAIKSTLRKIQSLKEKLKAHEQNPIQVIYDDDDDDDFTLEEPKPFNREKCENEIKALEEYLEENGASYLKVAKATDFPDMPWEEVIKVLTKNYYLRAKDNYNCPFNGKRTIKTKQINRNGEVFFDISCDCGKKEDPRDDFKPDSKPMKQAKEFLENLFEFQKEQFFKYYDDMVKMDHSKPMTEAEIKALSIVEIPAYKFNVLLMNLGFDYKSMREDFENKQKLIDDFIKTYDK